MMRSYLVTFSAEEARRIEETVKFYNQSSAEAVDKVTTAEEWMWRVIVDRLAMLPMTEAETP